MIRLHLLGSLSLVHADGTSVRSLLAQPKRFALLAYMSVSPAPLAHRRDTLLGILWPELDEEHARRALRQSLHRLRQSLGPRAIVGDGNELLSVDGKRLWCDAAAFDAAVREGRDEEAVDLYRGPLLDGFHLSGAPAFDQWVEGERRRLELAAVDAAWRLTAAAEDRTAARRWAERALALAPYDEEGLRRYLTLMTEHGQPAAAVGAYEAFAERLATDLELEPSAETVALAQSVRNGEASPLHASPAVAGVPTRHPPSGQEPEVHEADAPASGDEGVAALRREPSSPVMEEGGEAGSPPRRLRWRRAAGVGAAVGLLSLAGWALGTSFRDGPPEEGAVEEPPGPSIAVLAFDDLTAEGDQVWFADGIAEEILNALTRIEGLRVSARQSSFAFRGRQVDVRRIGDTLGVESVLEGSVRRGGDSVWVTAQLIDAGTGFHRWSETYGKVPTAGNLRAIQREIARDVAAALALRLGDAREAAAEVPTDAAYDLYLEGRSHLRRVQTEFGEEELLRRGDVLRSVELFRDVVARSPEWADGWAALGEALHWAASGRIEPEALYPESKAALERAVELDPAHARAHASLAFVLHNWDLDVEASEARYRHALALGGDEGWGGYAILLEETGRYEEAIEAYRTAEAHDPLSLGIKIRLGRAYLCAGRYEDAIAQAERGLALGRGAWPLWNLALALERSGRLEEALARIDRAADEYGLGPAWDLSRALLHARAGRAEEARGLLRGLDAEVRADPRTRQVRLATLIALGEPEIAMEPLEEWDDGLSASFPFDCRYPELLALEGSPR